jgi:hypothetical protein
MFLLSLGNHETLKIIDSNGNAVAMADPNARGQLGRTALYEVNACNLALSFCLSRPRCSTFLWPFSYFFFLLAVALSQFLRRLSTRAPHVCLLAYMY